MAPESISPWRTEAVLTWKGLSLADCLSFTNQVCVSWIYHPTTQLGLTACVITPLWGRMGCHSATDPRTEWQKACGSTHFTLWHSQNLRDSAELETSFTQEWKTGSPLNRMDGPKFRALKLGLNSPNNLPLRCHEKLVDGSRSPRQQNFSRWVLLLSSSLQN